MCGITDTTSAALPLRSRPSPHHPIMLANLSFQGKSPLRHSTSACLCYDEAQPFTKWESLTALYSYVRSRPRSIGPAFVSPDPPDQGRMRGGSSLPLSSHGYASFSDVASQMLLQLEPLLSKSYPSPALRLAQHQLQGTPWWQQGQVWMGL
jgi:hypothetical protein